MSFATEAMVGSDSRQSPQDTVICQLGLPNNQKRPILASLSPHVPSSDLSPHIFSNYSFCNDNHPGQKGDFGPPGGPLATHCAVPYFQNSPYRSFAVPPNEYQNYTHSSEHKPPEFQSQIKVVSHDAQQKESGTMNVNSTASEITKGFLKSTGVEDKRIGNLEDNVKKMHGELQRGLERDQNLNTRITTMESVSSEIKNLKNKIDDITNEADRDSILKIRKQLTTLESKMDLKLKKLELENKNIDSRVNSATTTLDSLNTTLDSLNKDNNLHKTNIRTIGNNLDLSIEAVNDLRKKTDFKSFKKSPHDFKALTKLVEQRKR